jgi:plastocyanin
MVTIALVVAGGLVALLPLLAGGRAETREIVLVAKDMTYFLEDGNVPNPTLAVPAGARVRIVVHNADPGFTHDFSVEGLGVAMKPLDAGSKGVVEFTAPSRPGRYEYVCTPHSAMMRGSLEVR